MKGLTVVLALAALMTGSGCAASGTTGSATPSPAPEPATAEIESWLTAEYGEYGPIRYALAWQDLDGDGADEAIAYVISPGVCGSGGCNTVILARSDATWRVVGNVSVSRTPVTVLDSSTKGWRDLTVDFAGGGGPSGTAKLTFDGETYPRNPTVPPAVTVDQGGAVLIAAEPAFTAIETE